MFSPLHKLFLAAAALFLSATIPAFAQSVSIYLKVKGWEDVDNTSTIIVSDGVNGSVGTVSAHGHRTQYGDPPEIAWDENGLPTEWGATPGIL